MQINRLFEIVYILLKKKMITAGELAEHFEVSRRTIYRDIDKLSASGIPIYTNNGKGGGIGLLPEFMLNNSVLSEEEQNQILAALQSLDALNFQDVEPVINKLSALFNNNSTSWIDIDFSRWGSNADEKEKFKMLKCAILERKLIKFDYYSSCGEMSKRKVEPLKLVFKGQNWYLYAYCTMKKDYRMFKVTRIKKLIATEEIFNRHIPSDVWSVSDNLYEDKMITLVLKVHGRMAYRLFDEFSEEEIKKDTDGSFIVTTNIPESDWIYGYVMSYGDYAEVIKPQHIRENIRIKLENGLKKYL